jgi:hypothetical protein
MVNLGATTQRGDDSISVASQSSQVQNDTATPVTNVGSTFTVRGVPLSPPSLSGVVFSVFNDDVQVDFGANGIAGVTIKLDGIDFVGDIVHLSQTTDTACSYVFNLLSGQPSSTSISRRAVRPRPYWRF